MLIRGLALLSLALLWATPARAAADYIRDEVRVNMRTGPSSEHRILRVLRSGEAVAELGKDDGWMLVRTEDGKQGWVPTTYVTSEVPASVSLPKIQAQLDEARAWIEELSTQIQAQAEAMAEIEGMRARNTELEARSLRLTRSDTWKNWFTGAAIAALFLAIGAMWPRGGPQRTRRIRL